MSISDYALIGDGETCALVSNSGSIDFLCWPRFDSPACFAALLGDAGNGRWQISPAGFTAASRRRYRGDTLLLETEFTTDNGRVRITDFMPTDQSVSAVIRIVEGIDGHVPMRMSLRLRFDNGMSSPWSRPHGRGLWCEIGSHQVVLHSPVDVEQRETDGAAEWVARPGERLAFALVYADSADPIPGAPDAEAQLAETERFWLEWIGRFDRPCRWPDATRRSLLTLKSLIHRRTGGLVAAPTFGLPEVPGGSMNWDYRYCWLRDATFTLTALLNAGYQEEARKWRDWILRAIAGQPDKMQIVYRLDGERQIPEREATWLAGFEGARPVLLGNAASGQTQLDVYGELLDGFHVAREAGIEPDERGVQVMTAIVEHLEGAWNQPGSDIWESRGEKRRYTLSQALACVGIERFIEGAGRHSDAAMLDRLRHLTVEIRDEVLGRGFDNARGHFVQSYGESTLDASLLLLPLVRFLPANDPRMAGTVAAIERELTDGGLVRRKAAKGDGRDEGVFLACSCWLADCMKMQGREDEAAAMLERVISLGNDVGLLSEEFHVPTQRLIGNFPQALTHLGVVNTALFLSGPVLQR